MKKLFFVALAIFSYYLFVDLHLPYVGPNATNFTVYSLIAHNFNKFGYLETYFAPVISVAPVLPQHPEYFFHHPTLLSFVESVLFRIFGESFWVGRLSVTLFAFGSFILTYFISKTVLNKKYALITLFVTALIPASTIFGKMIGQESLVLFFCLLSLYSIIKYLYFGNKWFLVVGSLAIVFGVLSDWPTAFFILCYLPLFWRHKKIKLGIYFVALSFVATFLLMGYVYFMRSGLYDLQYALSARSFVGLLDIPYWPIKWVAVTFSRMLTYFNPILLILAFFSLTTVYKYFRKQKLEDYHFIILGSFLFTSLHLLIYLQASYSHPYLIYYALPFVCFGSSLVLFTLFNKKAYLWLIMIAIFSIMYLLIIQSYKTQQIHASLWRYDITLEVSKYIPKYERILRNDPLGIDTDLLWYPFLINSDFVKKNMSMNIKESYKYFVFSCIEICSPTDRQLIALRRNYEYIYITNPQAKAYIFLLQRKRINVDKEHPPIKVVTLKEREVINTENSNVRKFYRYLRDLLQLPQF